jgi:hypothetical protein
MTRTCDECGDELDPERDKSRGRYRDRCRPCLEGLAAAIPSHVETCDAEACPVCQDYREEFGP